MTILCLSPLTILLLMKAAKAAAPEGSTTKPLLNAICTALAISSSVTVIIPSQYFRQCLGKEILCFSLSLNEFYLNAFSPAKGGARPAAILLAEVRVTAAPASRDLAMVSAV